jgi:hypothetical protein
MWLHVYVICACLVFLFVGNLLVCKLNEHKSAGRIVTAQSTAEDPLEDGREKRPKHAGVLYLQTRF